MDDERMARQRTTIFLADDNLIAREGVRALLSLEQDFEVAGVAADFDELLEGAEAAAPDVVVTDMGLHRLRGTVRYPGVA